MQTSICSGRNFLINPCLESAANSTAGSQPDESWLEPWQYAGGYLWRKCLADASWGTMFYYWGIGASDFGLFNRSTMDDGKRRWFCKVKKQGNWFIS